MRDDHELLLLHAKDPTGEAFSELVRRHLDLVYAAALRQTGGNTHLASDVAQSVFADLAARRAPSTGARPESVVTEFSGRGEESERRG